MAELAQPLETPAPWHLAKTHPRYEMIAKENLERQGFIVYLPLRLVADRRNTASSKPLYPRHLFFQVGPNAAAWRAVFSTRGIQSIYRSGDHPAVVPLKAMKKLRDHEDENGLVKIRSKTEVKPRWERGERLRLRGGALDGFDATFEEMVDANRISILVKVLGRETRVKLEMDQIT